MENLLIGIALIVIGTAWLLVCIPKGENTAWFVGNRFLEPVLPIFMIATVALGLLLVAGYFTTIDDFTFAGNVDNS